MIRRIILLATAIVVLAAALAGWSWGSGSAAPAFLGPPVHKTLIAGQFWGSNPHR